LQRNKEKPGQGRATVPGFIAACLDEKSKELDRVRIAT
jgi:hypothetical protein